ncbi:hypothetical protein JOL79_22210 [Microbispora sp. RL4-1S]|uniref:Uncharacterized protein n=1 Tax=Microbispora oryzae TaxID=2806554 RepID=A0A941AKV8_9ACTN|nr:hypothetical protein [Microbispora oryzae]MBP2706527.1 hypothetical protein [Microbispora oryzae]
MSARLEAACRVADAVLYEGYLLYPYRASAAKNRLRWQFGVLVPPGFSATEEPSASVTECLLEAPGEATVELWLRFLQVRARTVERAEAGGYRPVAELEAGGRTHLSYDDATDREVRHVLPLGRILEAERVIGVHLPPDSWTEPLLSPTGERLGRVVAARQRVDAALRVAAERLPGPYRLVRLHVRIENLADWDLPDAPREHALRRSLVAAHVLLGVTGGAFVSMLDPPEWARPAAELCRNEHTWPVLIGDRDHRDAVLSSPIILYDYPSVAPESQGDLFDATEIDELLTLSTLALTDAERREARATDPRAAAILDRIGDLPPAVLERLHGAVRETEVITGGTADSTTGGATGETPWWDPRADHEVSPETDGVVIGGVPVARGSRVRLAPGRRRADPYDMFLAGRTARVEAVLLDVDGRRHLAVTLDDDPGADLHRAHGRYLYFAPDEVEPIEEESS